jgi:hypothetical protein
MANQKIVSFVKTNLNLERDDDAGKCTKFVLKHVNANAKQNEVQSFDCRTIHKQTDGEKRETFIEQLIAGIEEAAHDDAESLGGHQRYLIFAYYQNESKPLARTGFRMDAGDEDEGDEELESEPANAKGLVAQAMRHQEGNFRTSVLATNHIINMMQRTIDTQQETINNLLSGHLNNLKLVEDLVSQRHGRELAAKREDFNQSIKNDFAQKALKLLPAVVNRFAGKQVLPGETPKDVMLQDLAKSISQEQMMQIAQHLKPEQQMIIFELLKNALPASEEESASNGSVQ